MKVIFKLSWSSFGKQNLIAHYTMSHPSNPSAEIAGNSSSSAGNSFQRRAFAAFHTSHCIALRPTASHYVPLRPAASHHVGLRPTASHYVPLRPIASHYVPLRPTVSHYVPLRFAPKQCTSSRAIFFVSSILRSVLY